MLITNHCRHRITLFLLCALLLPGCCPSRSLQASEDELSMSTISDLTTYCDEWGDTEPKKVESEVAHDKNYLEEELSISGLSIFFDIQHTTTGKSGAEIAHDASCVIDPITYPIPAPQAINALAIAYGASAWRDYFGVEVDEEPSLPEGIDYTLNSTCLFLLDDETSPQKVGDNHLLILIPAQVNGEDFTLNKLGALAQSRYFSRNEPGYRYYSDHARAVSGEVTPSSSYWVLMTRHIVKGSKYRTYVEQWDVVQNQAPGYSLPSSLETATSILMHYARHNKERLFPDDPWTYTRCRDVDENGEPIVVGGFVPSGFIVDDDTEAYDFISGVPCCQRL